MFFFSLDLKRVLIRICLNTARINWQCFQRWAVSALNILREHLPIALSNSSTRSEFFSGTMLYLYFQAEFKVHNKHLSSLSCSMDTSAVKEKGQKGIKGLNAIKGRAVTPFLAHCPWRLSLKFICYKFVLTIDHILCYIIGDFNFLYPK